MKIRTLLLGSAAVLAMAGVANAQAAKTAAPATAAKTTTAAPAAVVKAPTYVTVCDAYGLGYFILPGQKDTCLRVSGKIVFAVNWHTRATEGPFAGTSSPHESGWDTTSTGTLTFTAKRMTDHGDLIGNMVLTGSSNNATTITPAGTPTNTCSVSATKCVIPIDGYVKMSAIYIKLGGWEFGFDSSVFGSGTTKQISYQWDLLNKTTVQLGLDDPRDRWGSRLPRYYFMPDVVGSLAQTTDWGSWGSSFGFADVNVPENTSGLPSNPRLVWGVTAKTTIKLDAIAKGDTLAFAAGIGTGAQFVGAGGKDSGNFQDLFSATFKHVFNPSVNTTWKVQYVNPAPAAEQTVLTGTLAWTEVNENNFTVITTFTGNETLNNHVFAPVGSAKAEFTWTY